ncbi:MAG: A/G-specific adenine glycosylase [Clostridia bacterium]|nr:A/G-specific adenine glycosylase [Clostridia bacterium]
MINDLQNIVNPLLEWFAENKSDFSWRKDRLPYHVWISEIMLQQTRIEAVKRYYTRFISELPDIRSLSEVSDEKLLKLWEGLGYYSRARNLKKSAQTIMQSYNGVFPNTYSEIIKLSGIGEYTAGAIASICFNEKVTAVDGNVLRVVARLCGSKENVLLPEVKKDTQEKLQKILPEQSGNFNEALMELGEKICVAKGTPLCQKCPLRDYCTAFKDNLTAEIPVRIKPLKRKKEEKTIFLLTDLQGNIAVEKRPQNGLLSGMYQFPNTENFHTTEQLQQILTERQISFTKITFQKNAKHIFTHIEWHMKSYVVTVKEQSKNFLWVSKAELSEKYPLPTAFRQFLV